MWVRPKASFYKLVLSGRGSTAGTTASCRCVGETKKETQETLDLYGPEVKKPGSFAASAIMARRLVERGVRVVQILHRGWDQHGNLPADHKSQCKDTDQPSAALVKDGRLIAAAEEER